MEEMESSCSSVALFLLMSDRGYKYAEDEGV